MASEVEIERLVVMPIPRSRLNKMPCRSANGNDVYSHPTQVALMGYTGVYFYLNVDDGKMYIGSGSGLGGKKGKGGIAKRKNDHDEALEGNYHYNTYFQRAFNKHGSHKFVFGVLEYCNPEVCVVREQWWMNYYEVAGGRYGYNICPTAGSRLGMKHTDKARKKISEANLRRSPESREKHAALLRGRKATEEQKAKQSASLKESWAEGGKRHGFKHSEETKKHIGDIQRGKPKPEVAKALTGKKHPDEARAKQSESMREFWANNPEARKKVAEFHTGRKRTDETRVKMSEKRQATVERKHQEKCEFYKKIYEKLKEARLKE